MLLCLFQKKILKESSDKNHVKWIMRRDVEGLRSIKITESHGMDLLVVKY